MKWESKLADQVVTTEMVGDQYQTTVTGTGPKAGKSWEWNDEGAAERGHAIVLKYVRNQIDAERFAKTTRRLRPSDD